MPDKDEISSYFMSGADRCDDLQIGEWRVEPRECRLSRGDEGYTLQPRLMDLLVYLHENRGRVVSREEILDEIWASRHVTPHALNNAISKLRAVLERGGAPGAYIYTKRGFGYQLTAPQMLRREPQAPSNMQLFLARPTRSTHRVAGGLLAALIVIAATAAWRTASQDALTIAYQSDASALTGELALEGWAVEYVDEPARRVDLEAERGQDR